MKAVERFVETEICPVNHDRYVKEGHWQSHTVYCMCSCSYCQEQRLRKEYPDTGESGQAYDKEMTK